MTTQEWKEEVVDFLECFVPGWFDLGLWPHEALVIADAREEQQTRELATQGRELGWARAQ